MGAGWAIRYRRRWFSEVTRIQAANKAAQQTEAAPTNPTAPTDASAACRTIADTARPARSSDTRECGGDDRY
ncbi:hypothetical protein EKD16_07490 [Streptomonospora litoralis]|uniref:Uncharacterized protein n=1 Tax=Streptomonospora litoralis TaxID=2498135 RepID=A0A4P6Q3A9_9ACTN|nr:hypothetical protein EKD16_07490 [Streptomonospora litoralis]